MIVEGNAPIIEAQVRHGQRVRTARFLIDTGGGAIFIGSNVMTDIAAVPSGPEQTEGGERLVPLQGLTISVGGLELDLSGVKVVGTPANIRTMDRNTIEGILPASLLRKYRVVFDYPAQRFTIGAPGGAARGRRITSPIDAESGYPRIEAEIAGTKYGFLLDTGASFSMVSRAVLEGWSGQNPRWPTMTGAAGFANMSGNDPDKGPLLRVAKLKIGSFALPDVAMVSRSVGIYEKSMSDMMTAPIVGAIAGNVLRDFRVEIDYLSGATYLEEKLHSTDRDLVTVGLILGFANNRDPAVTAVCSAAGEDVKKSVLVRDRLIAVDGRTVNGEPLAAIAELLSGEVGTLRRLTIRRNGQQLDVAVRTKKLL